MIEQSLLPTPCGGRLATSIATPAAGCLGYNEQAVAK